MKVRACIAERLPTQRWEASDKWIPPSEKALSLDIREQEPRVLLYYYQDNELWRVESGETLGFRK
jgi:hypothetical protein